MKPESKLSGHPDLMSRPEKSLQILEAFMSGRMFVIRVVSPLGRRYSESFKRKVVMEYESGGVSKNDLMRKYNIGGHSQVLDWCRHYGKLHYPKGASTGKPMKDPQKQRIKELEKALENERLKVMAYEKLLEVIEREDGINLLKKDVAKQLKNLPRSGQAK